MGKFNWSTKSHVERQMLHQVGHQPHHASDIAKQFDGSPSKAPLRDWTALVLNVSPLTVRFQTHVGLKAILRASCSEQEKHF